MILARLARALRNQNWLAVFLEFIIVIAGVVIGFQITAWSEARSSSTQTTIFYQRLAEDLLTEAASRTARIAYLEQAQQYGEGAMNALLAGEPTDSQLIIDLYQASQTWDYSPQRSTYDELLNAGIANAIPDVNIRRELANIYLNLDNSALTISEQTAYRNNIRRFMPHRLQAAVRSECGDIWAFDDRSRVFITLPETCDLTFSPEQLMEMDESMAAYPELVTDLSRQLADLETKLATLRYHIPVIEAFAGELLEAAP
ncbi:hypothetical protein V0U79_09455 [Hyphobacterium sp. HN65]|uniref:Uncharacterized protein n=1 Tax=Hyphobacterium lacteum TaxID=3116575 RepID=A0ABU7LRP9_9PROT|nr:hypothetical protein [Hyphobacterium sp. HN65]MEE2526592.1 hypothetical protein [Hyphobacterium sp. HN65]